MGSLAYILRNYEIELPSLRKYNNTNIDHSKYYASHRSLEYVKKICRQLHDLIYDNHDGGQVDWDILKKFI